MDPTTHPPLWVPPLGGRQNFLILWHVGIQNTTVPSVLNLELHSLRKRPKANKKKGGGEGRDHDFGHGNKCCLELLV